MHSHKQTLLSNLGFNDADKKEPKHDIACRYIAQPEVAVRIINAMFPPRTASGTHKEAWDGESEWRWTRHTTESVGIAAYERAISKGTGQYKTTVGFIDVVIPYRLRATDEWRQKNAKGEWGEWTKKDSETTTWQRCEVKIQPVGSAEILRQINLYREYITSEDRRDEPNWIVATAWLPSDAELLQLKHGRCFHVLLGQKFEQYVTDQHEQQHRGSGAGSFEV